ncbi:MULTISPECIES: SfnB family sulfur acquisition oxidoreductase [Streptomyces]|uniref:SfnB family sulfur acquisition oxidoreductase n=1 Tax=Streptomyces caniscabiei TaxID=2746961 RepID=A0ABU4MVW4_9ACTN|nr:MULTISPECIES: SfnB family sulfur acquisition oxidoreductase [Streptomyces]MBE4737521.1 SfnB family sulfur acquisition oxidoreductase [Streptomyces caniscabiei]MBE4756281.1 SfnB family sulfur acquisition oxidoreductase [Streptomyces caniscabiei]MBE4769702.1 SfnB family sulfur acquisition oxidoreductase [Streptomyces caniscabiei]MBE4787352.1 SfnB family sulfur acquisition oxidoreductase [Streptomyces caniscabiei]MBE4795243.1 SfnB family sulfur acquisition oxidoreductase [Streptomyces caniscab
MTHLPTHTRGDTRGEARGDLPADARTDAPAGPRAAKVIADDAEALAVAAALAEEFRAGASERDAERRLPRAELDRLSASGLLAVTVPAAHGGADVSHETLAEIFRLLASADASLAQIPQSHFAYVNVLRRRGTPGQREFFFGELLAGRRFGNAQSEAGTRHVQDIRTRLEPLPDGSHVLDGIKHYATGALFADWIPVLARAGNDALHVAYVPRDAPGVTVIDDWDGLGQRTTASGTVRLEGVRVPGDRVLPHHLTFEGPQLHGAAAQLLHAAIDAGIAGGALAEAAEFVRTKSRPWFESGVETAAEDPLLIQRFGELALQVRASDALLREAARVVDTASGALTDDSAAEASIAVAAAKVQAANAALEVASALFEVSGTRSALHSLNLHRHWRDARTHTLHDPTRWKLQHIGRYTLNGTRPPRHGLL